MIVARIVLQLSIPIGTQHTVGRWIRTIDRCISARSVLFSANWRMRANQPSRSLGSIVGMRPCAASIKAGCVETITGGEKSRQADTTSPLTVGKRQHDREQCTAVKIKLFNFIHGTGELYPLLQVRVGAKISK